MSRPKSQRSRPKAARPLSLAEQARLTAMRDELWSRCIAMQAMDDADRDRGLSPRTRQGEKA